MGQPKKTLSATQIAEVERLAGLGLNERKIAYVMGMAPNTFTRTKREQVRVSEAIEKGRAAAEDKVASKLFDKALTGDLGAIVWWEKTRADRRETVKQEISGADGTPLAFTLSLDSPMHDGDGE
jgi:hypothetical protein